MSFFVPAVHADGFSIPGTGGDTGEKPQSKLWYADQTWWAVITRAGHGLHFYELDSLAAQWQPCAFMGAEMSTGGRADVKWNGSELFVLAYSKSPKLFKYVYDSEFRTWNLIPGFPVRLPITDGSETMVIDQDASGRLWTTWEGESSIMVAWSTSPDHLKWSEPLALRSGVSSDDISSVVAFDDKIGVFWSDQVRDEFGFRVHHDLDAPEVWQPIEVVDSGDGLADDHICIKAGKDGTLYAVTKDDDDKMFVHRRNVSTGTWTNKDGVISDTGTRGIIMVCDDDEKLYVAYTDWDETYWKIKLRRASSDRMDFSTYDRSMIKSTVSMNDVTGTKQVLPDGVFMAMATGGDHIWWNGWGALPPDGPPPPEAPLNLTATQIEQPRSDPPHPTLVMNLALDEGHGTITLDTTRNGHIGELSTNQGKSESSPLWIRGEDGMALQFDGDGYVEIESSEALKIAESFTIESWVRPHDGVTHDGTILSKGRSNYRNYQMLLLADGRIDFKWEVAGGSNRGLIGARKLTPGNWHHVACTYDMVAGRSSIYIDGQLDRSVSDSGTPYTNNESLYLGRRMSGSTSKDPLEADLDGVRVWRGVTYGGSFDPGDALFFPDYPNVRHVIRLTWQRPLEEERELRYSIALRREGRAPILLASGLSDTSWTHRQPPLGSLCYEITAMSIEDGRRGLPAVVCVEYTDGLPVAEPRNFHEDPTPAKSAPSARVQLTVSPNPFNPRTRIQLQMPADGLAELVIFDARGRRVASLHDGMLAAGTHSFSWNAQSESGARQGSGIYFLRGTMLGQTLRQRLVLLK